MKFQNSSIHGFKVMLCIKKRDERTDGRTNNPEAICPSNFFEVGGIKIDFQDGSHGGHLGFPISMILAIFDLQDTLMLPSKFRGKWPFNFRRRSEK